MTFTPVESPLPSGWRLRLDSSTGIDCGGTVVFGGSPLRVIRLSDRGPSAARNADLRAAHTPFVAFVDSDCVVGPTFPGRLLDHLADPAVAIAVPRIVALAAGPANALARYEARRSALDMGEREGLVRPNSPVPYAPSAAMVARAAALGHGFAVHKRVLLFPAELVVCPRLAEPTGLPALPGSTTTRLLVRYVNDLALELEGLDAMGQAAAARAALELLRAVVEPMLPTSRDAVRAAMRGEIGNYIRRNLQDADLGPASIARAHSICVRALHGLFEDVDESVAGLVRSERLARCMEDLKQPDGGSVTTIAFRWGFSDTSHFCRVFKRAFGMTPSEVRRAAVQTQTGVIP